MHTYVILCIIETTVRQGIFETIKFRGSLKIVENCNFRGINFCGIDTENFWLYGTFQPRYTLTCIFPCNWMLLTPYLALY